MFIPNPQTEKNGLTRRRGEHGEKLSATSASPREARCSSGSGIDQLPAGLGERRPRREDRGGAVVLLMVVRLDQGMIPPPPPPPVLQKWDADAAAVAPLLSVTVTDTSTKFVV